MTTRAPKIITAKNATITEPIMIPTINVDHKTPTILHTVYTETCSRKEQSTQTICIDLVEYWSPGLDWEC